MKIRNIWTLIILGLLLRLILIFWSFNFPQNPDLLRHRDWGKISFLYGPEKTYVQKYITYDKKPNNLPPGSTYIISAFYNFSIQVSKLLLKVFNAAEGSIGFINIYLVDFFLKIPSVLADLIISYFIYKIVKLYKNDQVALLSSSLFLFNPVVFYNSAIWGQIDALNNTAFIISLFFLTNKKIFLSVIFYSISLYLKLSLLPLLPLYLFFLYLLKIKAWKLIKYSLVSILMLFILTTFFFQNISQWPNLFILNNFKQEVNLITVNAFNFWYFIFLPFFPQGNFPSSNILYLFAYIIFILVYLPVFKFSLKYKNKLKPEILFISFSLISLLIFLFLPRMHERYLYPFFPLMAISSGLNKKFLPFYFVLSFFHFLNLLFVWHPMFGGLVSIVLTNIWLGWLSSFGIIVMGVVLYRKVIKYGLIL